jgi:hypothetical protein
MAQGRYATIQETIPHLQIADIVLVSTRGNVISQLIRKKSQSYWSHVALVIDFPSMGAGSRDVLLVEALDRGIEIHRLDRYVRHPEKYRLGIKRVPRLTSQERERIRGFFLDAVDTPYNFSRLFTFFLRSRIVRLFGRGALFFFARKMINLNKFICTTFAQRSFYLGVSEEKRERVLFRGDDDAVNFLHQMEEITPGHIAQSPRCVWLYNPHQ